MVHLITVELYVVVALILWKDCSSGMILYSFKVKPCEFL